MNRELNWVFDMNVSLVTYGSYPTTPISRAFLYYLKNVLVGLGGYEVVGSSANLGAQWEYQGVTAGGAYGGGSTGPYDVWTVDTDLDWASDGGSPAFALLKSPLWEGSRMYVLLGFGSGDSWYAPFWFAASNEMLELVGGGVVNYPVPIAGAEWVFWDSSRVYYGTGSFIGHLSVCTDNGSFILASRRTVDSRLTGIMAACRCAPGYTSTIALASGQASNFDSIFELWWHCSSPQQVWDTDVSPTIAGYQSTQWAEPMRRSGTIVMSTDLNTTNWAGRVESFPFYLINTKEDSNVEYKCGTFGRVPDLWVAPFGLADGDYVEAGGYAAYYVFGNWLIPGDGSPVV